MSLLLPAAVSSLGPSLVRRLRRSPRLPTVPAALHRTMLSMFGVVGHLPALRSLMSQQAVNYYAYATSPRPRPLTLGRDYTTWRMLTDRTYSGRHLPPATAEQQNRWPAEADVVALFRRGETMIPSTDTSATFMFFAQWFTDSFLRTSPTDPARNTSNHEIDMCQIYGLSEAQTTLLRARDGGRLKTQTIDGEEFPAFLLERREPGGAWSIKPEFAGLHDEDRLLGTILADASDAHRAAVFAVGLEHGNSTLGQTLMNTVFFREHNRIAGVLHDAYPAWDDDRLFDTARNVLIVVALKLVVEQYIKHIAPFDVPLQAVPFLADRERWNRSNWCAIEFNLLYRWHQLAPDAIGAGLDEITALINNNPLVLDRGVEALLTACSRQRAGRIGLGNTPRYLVDRMTPGRPSVEERTVTLMRQARLQSYNQYREAFGLPACGTFEELTADPVLRGRLQELYETVDDVEWYVGIFAEDYPSYSMMGELVTTMVAYDAFTQALTNPLLAANVFNAETFSEAGLGIIAATSTLSDIVKRNTTNPEAVVVEFSC